MTCWLCGSKTTNLVTNAQTPCNSKNCPCEICIAVANLDEEINQAVAALQRLVAKRNDLRSHQNRAHDALHRLPVELQNDIFQLLLPTQDKWGGIVRVGNSSRILMSDLVSVCRNWHDLALSNPSFWCTIRITLDTHTTSDPSKFVHDWIVRSRNMPLTLHIVVGSGTEEMWTRLLDVISAYSNRWHSLSLNIPFDILRDSRHKNLQYDRLRRLQIRSDPYSKQPVPLFNPTMSPEEIDIYHVSFQALQISWNHVTSATVDDVTVKDITRLFQHATSMTNCCIIDYIVDTAVTPIVHQNLKALRFQGIADFRASILLGSLTLPSLQDFHADDLMLLTPACLPALVHRSCCPLTSIRLYGRYAATFPLDLEPFPGVTNLVLETGDPEFITQLLLEEEYFPDLRYFTLQYRYFLFLWKNGTIRRLLDRNRPPSEAPNERRLLFVDKYHQFYNLWNSDAGEEYKALNIIFGEDGFEILL